MKKSLLKSVQLLIILSLFFVVGCNKWVPVTDVTLDKKEVTLSVGATVILKATVHPNDATNNAVIWTSDNTDVAIVSDGKVTAKKVGVTTITVTTEDGNYKAECRVEVMFLTEDEGVIINGVKWAKRNIAVPGTFVTNPEDAGMFYQWNRRVGWSSTDPMVNSNGDNTWDSSIPEGDSWEKANDPCPAGWRLPTLEEQQNLLAAGSEWTTLNGVNGRYFGSGENTVFFPAAGRRYYSDGSFSNVGSSGYYWSSTPDPDWSEGAFLMGFLSGYATIYNLGRNLGFSVRCVAE